MTNAEKFATLETLANKLLKACQVNTSPIFHKCCYSLGTNPTATLHDIGWRFVWNNSKRRIGVCKYRAKTIGLSRRYVENTEDPQLFVNTLLHEIAHILTPDHNHDDVWKQACRIVGANPERLCNDERIVGANQHLALWVSTCKTCNELHQRHRRPKYINSLICVKTPKCRTASQSLYWEYKGN